MNEKRTKKIVVAKDFSRYPAGRYPKDGLYNGTTLQQKYLVPALQGFDRVEVIFDGVAGFGSSFLDEAFGGLVRKEGMDKNFLDNRLVVSTTEPDLEDDILLTQKYMAQAVDNRR